MDGKPVRDLILAAPFQPFRIHLPDGQKLEIEHADNVALSPSGRTFFIVTDEGTTRIDTAMIVRVDVRQAA